MFEKDRKVTGEVVKGFGGGRSFTRKAFQVQALSNNGKNRASEYRERHTNESICRREPPQSLI